MKGIIRKIDEGLTEILVKPDRGSAIPVEIDMLGPDDLLLFSSETNPKLKDMLTKNPPIDTVICFVGDRVSYKKTGSGSYIIEKLIVSSDDPRCGHPLVRIE